MAAIAAAGDLTVPVFDPLSLPWTHAWWAEGPAMAALGYSDGGLVGTWPDEIGSADLTQATSANRPVFRASSASFNSKPMVDGAVTTGTEIMSTAAFASAYAQPLDVVLVVRWKNTASPNAYFDRVGTLGFRIRMDGDLGVPTRWGINFGTNQRGSAADTTTHLQRARADSTSTLYNDEVAVATGSAGSNSLTGVTLFGQVGGGGAAVQVAFVGIAKPVLSGPDIASLHEWAQDHYGTP
jgi:hypothetical protein